MNYKKIDPCIFKFTITENYNSDDFEKMMKKIIDAFEIPDPKNFKCILFGNESSIYKLVGNQFHINWDTSIEFLTLPFKTGMLELFGYDILIISEPWVTDSVVYVQFALK